MAYLSGSEWIPEGIREGDLQIKVILLNQICVGNFPFSCYPTAEDYSVFRYWEPTYEDSLSLIAQLPVVAAYVYRRLVNLIAALVFFYGYRTRANHLILSSYASVTCLCGSFWIDSFLFLWRIYKNGQVIPKDDSLDYGANFSNMLGFDSPEMHELMRLYITIHRCIISLCSKLL